MLQLTSTLWAYICVLIVSKLLDNSLLFDIILDNFVKEGCDSIYFLVELLSTEEFLSYCLHILPLTHPSD